MINIKLQSLISALNINISDALINAVKKGLSKELTKSFFDLKSDIETFIKSGLHKSINGVITDDENIFYVINIDETKIANVEKQLQIIVDKLGDIANTKKVIIKNQFEIYISEKDYHNSFDDVNTFNQLLKVIQDLKLKFDSIKILSDKGVTTSLYDFLQLKENHPKIQIRTVQYDSQPITLFIKNIDDASFKKIIQYHLKFQNGITS